MLLFGKGAFLLGGIMGTLQNLIDSAGYGSNYGRGVSSVRRGSQTQYRLVQARKCLKQSKEHIV